jgi:hypothetical protein
MSNVTKDSKIIMNATTEVLKNLPWMELDDDSINDIAHRIAIKTMQLDTKEQYEAIGLTKEEFYWMFATNDEYDWRGDNNAFFKPSLNDIAKRVKMEYAKVHNTGKKLTKKELQINAWIKPNGQFIGVGEAQHEEWAREELKNSVGVEKLCDVYDNEHSATEHLQNNGWVRLLTWCVGNTQLEPQKCKLTKKQEATLLEWCKDNNYDYDVLTVNVR